MSVKDQNGNSLHRRVQKESDGTWGVNVWFGGGVGIATNMRRYYYTTRAQAIDGDISDGIGERGKVGGGKYFWNNPALDD